jgi:Ca2+-binding EF-hand superfamily protein
MNLKILLGTASLLLMASPALAQTPPAGPQGQVQRMGPFDRLDANKDGVVTRDEVRASRNAMFDRLDTNKDNSVTVEEVRSAPDARVTERRMIMVGPDGEPRREVHGGRGGPGEGRGFRMRIEDMDANKDGTITRQEFEATIAQRETERRAKANAWHGQAFDRLDPNKDGRITREEMDAVRERGMAKYKEKVMERRAAGGGGRGQPDIQAYLTRDGKISRDEWLARPDPMFDNGDANKDGRLTREEAAAAHRAREEGRKGPGRPW